MTAKEYTDRAMKIMPMQQLGKHGKEHIRKCLLVLFEECLNERDLKIETNSLYPNLNSNTTNDKTCFRTGYK